MKKKNFLIATVSNVVIIALLALLYFVTNPVQTATNAYSPIYSGEKNVNNVSLMFNVYEGSEYVEKILDILEEKKVTCTFFVGGIWAEKNVNLLGKMSERTEIGNHGYLHLDHKKLSKRRNEEEIMLCHNLIDKLVGIKMNLFAPPSGSYGEDCLSVCEKNGYTVVMWSKDTIDWRDKDSDLILKRATSDIQNGDLILMHPTEQTVKALPGIIDEIKKENFNLVTVGENLGGF